MTSSYFPIGFTPDTPVDKVVKNDPERIDLVVKRLREELNYWRRSILPDIGKTGQLETMIKMWMLRIVSAALVVKAVINCSSLHFKIWQTYMKIANRLCTGGSTNNRFYPLYRLIDFWDKIINNWYANNHDNIKRDSADVCVKIESRLIRPSEAIERIVRCSAVDLRRQYTCFLNSPAENASSFKEALDTNVQTASTVGVTVRTDVGDKRGPHGRRRDDPDGDLLWHNNGGLMYNQFDYAKMFFRRDMATDTPFVAYELASCMAVSEVEDNDNGKKGKKKAVVEETANKSSINFEAANNLLDVRRKKLLLTMDTGLLFANMNPFGKMLLVMMQGKWFDLDYMGHNLWKFQITSYREEKFDTFVDMACVETVRRLPMEGEPIVSRMVSAETSDEVILSLEVTGYRLNQVQNNMNSNRVSARVMRILGSREGARAWKKRGADKEEYCNKNASYEAMERMSNLNKIFYYDIEANTNKCSAFDATITSICGSLCTGGDVNGGERVIFALAAGVKPEELVRCIQDEYSCQSDMITDNPPSEDLCILYRIRVSVAL
ncbi:hypothetical protein O3P69_018812 [Scylla paramamosain]|uniref:Uncharacterized protein n=1 Tax=Scylla paramamosain TaxID=85552 RepID=A0AAW0ST46_SCYPA